jgi:hypothetical protein
MTSWPHLEHALGNLSGAFYLLIAMAMVPEVKAIHESMGVASDITRDTCRQVPSFAGNYSRATNGRVGIPLKQLYWLRHYTAGRLFRIGRMEYMLRPFGGGVLVYRHKQSRKALALAPDGVRFDANGYVISPGDHFDEKSWIATITQTSDTICGYPISPEGYALSSQVYLPLADWEQVLGKGDLALEMHIPSGGGMTPERCADSIRRAVAFFQQFFPTQTFQAVTCSSWILNTQLRQINLSSTNLADFQRELYLYPVRSSGQDGLWFIFLQDSFDLATAPRATSLQRSVADFLATGVRWRGGGMFFLVEHLDFFGSQYYHRTGLPQTVRE